MFLWAFYYKSGATNYEITNQFTAMKHEKWCNWDILAILYKKNLNKATIIW